MDGDEVSFREHIYAHQTVSRALGSRQEDGGGEISFHEHIYAYKKVSERCWREHGCERGIVSRAYICTRNGVSEVLAGTWMQ
ncbi:unnamed protein product, partial [Ectocarpus sp. 12 AP-2014]